MLTLLSMSALASPPGTLEGTWVFADRPAAEKSREAVVDATAGTFNFAIRGFARGRLRKVACLDEKIAIAGMDGKVKINFTGENTRESIGPWDGSPIDLRDAKVTFDVTTDKVMVVEGVTGDGGKKSTYEITGPNTMRATHEVRSGMLDAPMRWSLDYKRQ